MSPLKLINGEISVSTFEAEQLWQDSCRFSGAEAAYMPYDSRISLDGQFIIRETATDDLSITSQLQNAEKICVYTQKEVARFRQFGMQIITCAHIPLSADRLYTITPFIKDITLCEENHFIDTLSSKIIGYYLGTPLQGIYLSDTNFASQYSASASNRSKGFWHDPEPFLSIMDAAEFKVERNIRGDLLVAHVK